MKPQKHSFMVRLLLSTLIPALFLACGKNVTLKDVTRLEHYPSASGIEYRDQLFYIIGDDARHLLVLDSLFHPVDSLFLSDYPEKRIPKAVKPDLEAITFTADNRLLLTGSGSLSPYRNTAWLIDPVTKQKDSIRLDTFYRRLLQNGITEINIEGICSIPGYILLNNRGSKGYPKNQLIFTRENFWEKQSEVPITVLLAGTQTDTNQFQGVSGMAYSKRSDRLIMTVSTEDTRNSLDDGAIGKSYLWITENISTKRGWKALNPTRIIDLEKIDPRFKGQKIESVCIVKETGNFLHLVLAADNDDGSSTLFKLIAEKD